jgi:NAD(P)H-hydrate epimerase
MKSDTIHIQTGDPKAVKPVTAQVSMPRKDSHKGENGRLLIVGGSASFHAASLWSAETASHIVDIVQYASTEENNQILLSLRKKFRNGIVVSQGDIPYYIEEDDAILIGPGMERGDISEEDKGTSYDSFADLMTIPDEHIFTYHLIKYVLARYPEKKFVFDAAALQMLDPTWFDQLKHKPVVTPHQKEFHKLFGMDVSSFPLEEKQQHAEEIARKHNCVIVLKAVTDIITDGQTTYTITGGNQGLTKGGTGDVLAGLISSLYTKNEPLISAVMSSVVLKQTGDRLYETYGYWYNVENIIDSIPGTLKQLLL